MVNKNKIILFGTIIVIAIVVALFIFKDALFVNGENVRFDETNLQIIDEEGNSVSDVSVEVFFQCLTSDYDVKRYKEETFLIESGGSKYLPPLHIKEKAEPSCYKSFRVSKGDVVLAEEVVNSDTTDVTILSNSS